MKTSQPELIATPQFDSGRWKLRLERAPISADKQLNGPLVSSIAVGFTMLSPLVFLATAYLLARAAGNGASADSRCHLRIAPKAGRSDQRHFRT